MYQLLAERNTSMLCPLECSSCRTAAMLTQGHKGYHQNPAAMATIWPLQQEPGPARSNRIVFKHFLGEQYEKVYIDNIVESRNVRKTLPIARDILR